ncbi:MAG TPA: hypothetical protein VF691_21320, partial [Cytophagaceae bacterium]
MRKISAIIFGMFLSLNLLGQTSREINKSEDKSTRSIEQKIEKEPGIIDQKGADERPSNEAKSDKLSDNNSGSK